MSNIYNLEPPTNGKVILKTSVGDIDIELWPKEAPMAVRNFVQLCLEGYYDNTLFHRVIRDFIVQGGDPTGTGTGGETIYGQPFKDEFHGRLKFNHRGLLACANQNAPNTNGSQFFLTLAAVDSLNKKNTIFGKVAGDTIYNLLRMGELDVDDDDRPLYPPKLLTAEVVVNPFEDIAPRTSRTATATSRARSSQPAAAEGDKRRAGGSRKNLTLLSFGEEAEEEEEGLSHVAKTRIRSAHDVLQDKRLVGEAELPEEAKELLKLAQQRRPGELQRVRDRLGGPADVPVRQQQQPEAGGVPAARDSEDAAEAEGGAPQGDFAATMRAKMAERRREMGDAPEPKRQRPAPAEGPPPPREQLPPPPPQQRNPIRDGGDGDSGSEGSEEDEEREARRRRQGDQRRGGERGDGDGDKAARRTYGRMQVTNEVVDADLLKPWQLAREKYKSRKRQLGSREKDTLARLNKFSAALRTKEAAAPQPEQDAPPTSTPAAASGIAAAIQAEEAWAEGGEKKAEGDAGYAGEVRGDVDHRAYMPAAWRVDDYLAIEGDGGLADLRNHRFEFVKGDHKGEMSRRDDVDDYVVFDPLLEKAKGKFSKTAAKAKKSQLEWAGRSLT